MFDKEDLVCPISRMPFSEPVSVSCCGKLFEKDFLKQHFASKKNCPTCRASKPAMQTVPHLFAAMIKEQIDNDAHLKEEQYKPEPNVLKHLNPSNWKGFKQFFIEYPAKINDFFNQVENPLFALVRYNKKNRINELLTLGANINSLSPVTDMSAVQYAVTLNALIALQELVNAGAHLNWQCNEREFSYHMYCEEDEDEEASEGEYILQMSAPLFTALHMAVQFNRPDACRILIKAGAALFIENEIGQTPYELAEELDNDCLAVFDEREALYHALKEDLLDDAPFSEDLINRIGHYAMTAEDGKSLIESCFTYLKANDPLTERETALINYQKETILDNLNALYKCENACELISKTNFLDELLDSNTGSALHHFAYLGSLEGVKLMIERGAQINLVNPNGMTSLMLATEQGHHAIVQYLLEKKAVICIWNNHQILTVSHSNCPKIISLFIETKILFNIVQELRLDDHRVKETLLKLFLFAPNTISFLKKFKAVNHKLQSNQLNSIIDALIETEQMYENLMTVIDFMEIDNEPPILGKRQTFFSSTEDEWSVQTKQLLSKINVVRKNWDESEFVGLRKNYHTILDSMPSAVREWAQFFIEDLPEHSQKRLKN